MRGGQNLQMSRRSFLKAIAIAGAAATTLSPGLGLTGLTKKAEAAAAAPAVQVFTGRCHECHVQCYMQVFVRDGRVLKVQGDQTPNNPGIVNRGALCAKGQASVKNLYSPERLNYPFKRTKPKGEADPGWVRISWDEALSTIAAKIADTKAKFGAHSIVFSQGTGRYTNDFQARLANSVGTPNLLGPSHVCRGPMAATVCLTVGHHLRNDWSNSALEVFWGRNELWSHAAWSDPGIMDNLVDRQAKLLVVDPRASHPLASKADVYLPVRPGSDGALFLSFINVMITENLFDKEFVTKWTNAPMLVRLDNMLLLREGEAVQGGDGKDFLTYPASIADRSKRPTLMVWDTVTNSAQPAEKAGVTPALLGTYTVNGIQCKTVLQLLSERAAPYAPEKAAEICWIGSADKIRQAARLYATSKSAATDVGSFGYQGIEGGHTNTFQTIRSEVILCALAGNINKPGGEMGTPHWTWVAGQWKRDGGFRTMTPWGAPDDDFTIVMEGPFTNEPGMNEFPMQPGMAKQSDLFRAMVSGQPYPIKTVVMIQGNPLGGWAEDQKIVYEGLKALDFLADQDLYITPTNNLADIVLPAGLGPFERGATPVFTPMYERWPDEKTYVELGKRVNPKIWFWQSENEWWSWKAAMEGANIGKAKAAGIPIERGAPAPGAMFYKATDPKTGKPIGFATPTGRIEIYSVIAKQRGVDPLPNYVEPDQSPSSDLAKTYPLVLTTGARLPVYYHSEHRSNPLQRELFPHPEVDINVDTGQQLGIANGDWVWIETKTGKIRMKAKLTVAIDPRVVSMSHGWWQGCRELGLPGYGWDGANANVLVASDKHDPALGVPGTRSQLCKVYKAAEPPYVWDPPYYGTTEPEAYRGPQIYPLSAPKKEA